MYTQNVYDPGPALDPRVANVFVTAGYRYGTKIFTYILLLCTDRRVALAWAVFVNLSEGLPSNVFGFNNNNNNNNNIIIMIALFHEGKPNERWLVCLGTLNIYTKHTYALLPLHASRGSFPVSAVWKKQKYFSPIHS